MNELKATPGNWIVDNSGAVVVEGSGGAVGYPPSNGTIASLCDGEYIENPNEYDACLIAAAKDLYRELSALQAWITDGGFERHHDVAQMCSSARSTLAKARGEK